MWFFVGIRALCTRLLHKRLLKLIRQLGEILRHRAFQESNTPFRQFVVLGEIFKMRLGPVFDHVEDSNEQPRFQIKKIFRDTDSKVYLSRIGTTFLLT
jgi:hypothetical protein